MEKIKAFKAFLEVANPLVCGVIFFFVGLVVWGFLSHSFGNRNIISGQSEPEAARRGGMKAFWIVLTVFGILSAIAFLPNFSLFLAVWGASLLFPSCVIIGFILTGKF